MIETTILIGISVLVNISVLAGTNWTPFKNWLAKCFKTYHIHIINKNDNVNNITTSFDILTQFIHFILENRKDEESEIEVSDISINGNSYNTIPGLSTLKIDLKISNERKIELNIKENQISFWILSKGSLKESPTAYEIWTENVNQLSDVYSILTLFFRNNNLDPNELINFTRTFRIKNKRIQNETFDELVTNVKSYVRTRFEESMGHVSLDDNKFKILDIDINDERLLTNGNNDPLEMKRIIELNQIVTYMNKIGNVVNSHELKLAICVKNQNIIYKDKLNTRFKLKNFISDNQRIFDNNNEKNSIFINTLAIIFNFKTFINMMHYEINSHITNDQIEGINNKIKFSNYALDECFKNLVTKTINKFKQYPFISQIMLIVYLRYKILRNNNNEVNEKFDIDKLIDKYIIDDPEDILFGKVIEKNDIQKNLSSLEIDSSIIDSSETQPLIIKKMN